MWYILYALKESMGNILPDWEKDQGQPRESDICRRCSWGFAEADILLQVLLLFQVLVLMLVQVLVQVLMLK